MMQTNKLASNGAQGRGFWVGWALAFLGFPLGGFATWMLLGPITTPLAGATGGALTGTVLGAVQWLALRRGLPLSPWWIAATALGMATGLALEIVLVGTRTDDVTLPLRGLITGVSIGMAQFLLLRSISGRAPVWALSVALGWALGWTITRAAGIDLSQQWTVFGSSGAIVFQLLTGVALSWALRQGRVASGSQAELAA
jgi:hypothetical protein